MKNLFPLLAFSLLTISSCKKENTSTPAAKSQWTLGSTTHTVNSYAKTNESYYAYDAEGNGIGFSFAAYPTTAGSYTVINDDSTLEAGQVKVFVFGTIAGNTYFSTGTENKKAEVSFENSKIKIALPEVWVKKAFTDDSLRASASLGAL